MGKKHSRFGANVVQDVEKRKNQSSSYGYLNLPKGITIFKETKGTVNLDIIPYIVSDAHHPDGDPDNPDAANPGNPWYKRPIYTHRSVGADNQSVICPKTIGKKCPICEHRNKQLQGGVEKESVVDKAQLRNLYVVVPLGHKEYEEKFHIWDISNGNFQKELDEELGENPEKGVFPDPEDGLTLSIRFSEATFGKNKYFETSRIDFERRSETYDESVMDKAPKLDDILSIMSYKELEMMFFEISEEDVADEGKSSIKKDEDDGQLRKKKVVSEEQEEESPRKKKVIEEEEEQPKRRKSVVEELEEEQEEEKKSDSGLRRKKVVEEEEEDRPKRKAVAEEEEEEEQSTKPGVRQKKSLEPSPSKGGDSCPSDHKFGVDWDEYDDCDDCPLFEACGKKNEQLAA